MKLIIIFPLIYLLSIPVLSQSLDFIKSLTRPDDFVDYEALIPLDDHLFAIKEDFPQSTVVVFDISNKENPEEIIDLSFSVDRINDIKLSGNHIYILGDELSILDVSNPSNPSLTILEDIDGISLDIKDNNLIIGRANRLSIFDISSPLAPSLLNQHSEGLFEVWQQELIKIIPNTNTAWVLRNGGHFHKMDFSDPSNFTVSGQIFEIEEIVGLGEKITDLEIVGDFVVGGADQLTGLDQYFSLNTITGEYILFDLSGVLEVVPMVNMAIHDSKQVIGMPMDGRMDFINISNPHNPSIFDTIEDATDFGVFIEDYLYLIDDFRIGVYQLNGVSNPESIESNFSASNASIESGEEVIFTDQSSDNVTIWSWTFEGGTPSSSTDQNPVITYNSEGIFDVTLEVSNGLNTDTDTETKNDFITVTAINSQQLEADFAASATVINEGESINFSDNSVGNPTSWAWSFPGGTPSSSTQQNPSVTYNTFGSYSVSLTLGNGSTTADTIINNLVTVNAVADPCTQAQIASLGFNSTSAAPAWFEFTSDFSGEIIISSTSSGVNTNLEVFDGCGGNLIAASDDISIQSFESEITHFVFTGETIYINWLNTHSSSGFSWSIEKTDQQDLICEVVETIQNPEDGDYNINYQDSYGDGWNGASINVNIDGMVTSFTLESGATGSSTFNVAESSQSLSFEFVSGDWDSELSAQIFAPSGYQMASLLPSPPVGPIPVNYCVDQLDLNQLIAEFSSNLNNISEGEAVQFTDISQGEPTSWSWIFEGGTPSSSSEQNPTVTYDSEGSFDVSLEVFIGASSDSSTKNDFITVTPSNISPVVANEIDDQELTGGSGTSTINLANVFSDGDGDNLSYEVSSDDESVASVGISGSVLTITEEGPGEAMITITATDADGASVTTSFEISIMEVTGLVNTELSDKIKLMPNPSSGQFTLGSDLFSAKNVELSIYDLSGKLVRPLTMQDHGNQLLVSVSPDVSGILLIYLQFDQEVAVKKLLIKR